MYCVNLLGSSLACIYAFSVVFTISTPIPKVAQCNLSKYSDWKPARVPCASAATGWSHRRSLSSEMIVTRTLTSVPTCGSTCISYLLQRYSLSHGRLTSNICRRISTRSPTGMDFPAGLSHPKAKVPIVNIGSNSAVYPLGAAASSQRSIPSLRFEDCEMVVEEGQAWVVVGTSGAGKDVLLQVCGSYHYGC